MTQTSKASQDPPTIESNPWLTSSSHNGLVSIGTHSLHLQVSGPPRKPDEAVAIIIQGLGARISSWAALIRLLSPHIRTYTYSRSGFTPSENGPLRPTTDNIATELVLLLYAAGVKPPYVLIVHSWGGIIFSKFVVNVGSENIAGAVFVESNQVQTLDVLDWRPIALWFAASNIDIFKVLEMETNKKLDDEEWDAYLKDMSDEGNNKAGEQEWAEYEGSFQDLKTGNRAKEFVLNCPVSVIKGQNGIALQKLYHAVIEKDYGTKVEQEKFWEFLETFDDRDHELQSELMRHSNNSRFVLAENSGHDIQITEPEVIVEQGRWILEQRTGENKQCS